MEEIRLEQIALDQCKEDPNQPRRTFPAEQQRQLQSSIAKIGQLEPGHVRLGETDGKFIILSGARRFRAVSAEHQRNPDDPRFQTFKAIVGGSTDAYQQHIVRFVSNQFREDVPATEKALYVAGVMQECGPNIRTSLGLRENDIRYCKQIAKAPDWVQAFGLPQQYKVLAIDDDTGLVKPDKDGRPATEIVARPGLALSALVQLERYRNALSETLRSAGIDATEADAIIYNQVRRMGAQAQKQGWSRRQITSACARAADNAAKPPAAPVAKRWFDAGNERLSVDWRKLDRANASELALLVESLQAALTRAEAALERRGAMAPPAIDEEMPLARSA